jgi:hypothetical protein
MDFHEIGGRVDWIDRAQYRGQMAVSREHDNKSSGSIKCGEFLDWLLNESAAWC